MTSYTSKMCPICGCIEDENRLNQEAFECVECGQENARSERIESGHTTFDYI